MLVMITTNTHKYPYGTILSVVRDLKKQNCYVANVAETRSRIQINKTLVREI